MESLTCKQKDTLNFIKKNILRFKPVSVGDIAKEFSISGKAAYDRIIALRKKGYIEYSANKNRALVPIDFKKEIIDEIITIMNENNFSITKIKKELEKLF